MNTLLKYSLATLLGLGSVNIASAATINEGTLDGTDVGLVDTLKEVIDKTSTAWTDLYGNGNSTADETAWVNDTLSTTGITFEIKTETVSYFSTDIIDVFAFAFNPTGDDYFIVKNATYLALFENLASLDYGVFNASALPSEMNISSGGVTISHVSSFNDPNSPPIIEPGPTIPEPTSIFLIGTGLLGLFGASRKKS